MSDRTDALPAASGLHRVVRSLRYHEASRQLLGIALILLWTLVGEPSPWSFWPAVPLVAGGAAVRMWASGCIFKNKVLATSGPYAFVRHPLYLGNILALLGFALASALWWAAPLLLAFLWFYYPTAIEYEDRKLHRLFGEAWLAWSARVPALFPRGRRATGGERAGWSLMQSLRRNGEPVVLAYLLGCALWLYAKIP